MGCLQVSGWLLFHVCIDIVIFACGLTTAISSGLVRDDFGGACILYGNVNCTLTNTTPVFTILPGEASICTFITAVNVLVSVFFVAIICGYHIYYLIQSRTLIRVVHQMALKPMLASSVVAALLTLFAACTLSAGLADWCSTVELTAQKSNATVSSCYETQSPPWTWHMKNADVQAGRYYDLYSAAQTTCWISVCLWFLESAIYVRHLIKNRQLQRSYQDPFTIDDLDTFT